MMKTSHKVAIAIGGAGVAALGILAVRRATRAISHIGPVTASVTVNQPPRAVYEFFRDFRRLPEFMDYLVSVEENGEKSTWTAKLPIKGTVTWEAEIIDDVPGKLISWQSLPGSLVQTRGRVTFTKAPGREMTEVRVEMQLGALGKKPTAAIARLFATPQVKGDMRRFKQVLETGEVLRSDASAHDRPHPAQPSLDAKPAPDLYIPHVANVQKGVVS